MLLAGALFLGVTGCGRVIRTLTVQSIPAGAEVVLDGRTVGTTPYTEEFLSHGVRRCELRLPGYRREVVALDVERPWWQVFPISFVTDVCWPVDLHDDHVFTLELVQAGIHSAGFADAEEAYERFMAVRRFLVARDEAFHRHRPQGPAESPPRPVAPVDDEGQGGATSGDEGDEGDGGSPDEPRAGSDDAAGAGAGDAGAAGAAAAGDDAGDDADDDAGDDAGDDADDDAAAGTAGDADAGGTAAGDADDDADEPDGG